MLIIGVIVASSLKLVIDTYFPDSDPDSYSSLNTKNFVYFLNYIDIVFTAIFTVEMSLKILSYGFVMDMNSYLTDSWSKLDFFIVFFSLMDLALSSLNLGFLKIIRMLRILRPLRFINKNPNMKVLVNCLFESMGSLANVTIVIVLIL